MPAVKKWTVERESADEIKTELMTDQELDRASGSIAVERAQGKKVELRLATETEREQTDQHRDREGTEPKHSGRDIENEAYQKTRSATEGREREQPGDSPQNETTRDAERTAPPAQFELER